MKELLETGHVNAVTSISFSSDSRTLVTGSYDGTAKVWEVSTGQLLNTLIVPSEKCPCRSVNRVCFTPGNQTVVCEVFSGVLLWERASSECKPFPGEGCDQVISSGRRLALSVHDHPGLVLWDADGWRKLKSLSSPCRHIGGATLSTSGNRAVVFGECETYLHLLDTATDAIVWTIPFSNGWGATAAFSPDDRLLACANSSNRPRILDAKTGQTVVVLGAKRHRQIGSGSWYHHLLAFSADGRTLATAGHDGMLKLWDVPSGRLRSVLSEPDLFTDHIDPETATHKPRPAAHKSWIRTIAFSPDGRLLASAGDDCLVKLWNPATGGLVGRIGKLRNQIHCVALSTDDRFIVSGQEDGTLRLWNLGDDTLNAACSAHSEPVVSLALTTKDALVSGCSNGEVRTWELPTLRRRETLREADGSVRSVACWGDSWVVAGGHRTDGRTQAGDVRLWNLATGSAGPAITGWGEVPAKTCGGWWAVDAVVLSPDGRTLATAVGNEVRLWNTKTGQPVGTFVTSKDKYFDRVISLTYSPDGRSLVGGTVGYNVALWDTATGERRTIRAKRDSICDIAFTPDGSQLAICTHYENIVWLHDLESGELVGTFEGHVNSVAGLAYSANGDLLVTAGTDGFVGVWDAERRQRVRFLRT